MLKLSDDQLVFTPPVIRSAGDFVMWTLLFMTFLGGGVYCVTVVWPPETLLDMIIAVTGFGLVVVGLYIFYRALSDTEFVFSKDGQVRVYKVQGSRRTLKESLDIENTHSAAVVIDRINERGDVFLARIMIDNRRALELCRFKSLGQVRRVASAVAKHLRLELRNQFMKNAEVLEPEVADLPLIERLPALEFQAVGGLSKAVEHRALPEEHQFLFQPIGFKAIVVLLIVLGVAFLILAGLVVGEEIVETGTFGLDSPGIRVVVGCFLFGSFWIALGIMEGLFTRWNLIVDSKGLTVETLRFGLSDRRTIPLADLYEIGVVDSPGEGLSNSSSIIVVSSEESFQVANLHHMADLLTVRALILEFLTTRAPFAPGQSP